MNLPRVGARRRVASALIFLGLACSSESPVEEAVITASDAHFASSSRQLLAAVGGAGGAAGSSAGDGNGADTHAADGCSVKQVPDELRARLGLGAFYQKYANAHGVAVVTSEKPADQALTLACQLLDEMLSERPDVRAALIANKAHFTIIGKDEATTDTPEYSSLPDYYNTRARGLGGLVGSCAEENVLCDRSRDRWYGESICVHEFSHTLALYGLYSADTTFQARLEQAYRDALAAGKYHDTYASEQVQEYWAEGVQNWYDTNLEASPANGVHHEVNTQAELEVYDPALFALIDELLPRNTRWSDCYKHEP